MEPRALTHVRRCCPAPSWDQSCLWSAPPCCPRNRTCRDANQPSSRALHRSVCARARRPCAGIGRRSMVMSSRAYSWLPSTLYQGNDVSEPYGCVQSLSIWDRPDQSFTCQEHGNRGAPTSSVPPPLWHRSRPVATRTGIHYKQPSSRRGAPFRRGRSAAHTSKSCRRAPPRIRRSHWRAAPAWPPRPCTPAKPHKPHRNTGALWMLGAPLCPRLPQGGVATCGNPGTVDRSAACPAGRPFKNRTALQEYARCY